MTAAGAQRLAGLFRNQPHKQIRRRHYSFFSSKGSGNGARYFTGNSNSSGSSAKARVARVGAVKETTTTATVNAPVVNKSTTATAIGVEPEPTTTIEDVKEPLSAHHSEFVPPLSHPSLTTRKLGLHQFFSLHRPLLLLPNPTSSLFEEPSLSTLQPSEEDSSEMTEQQQHQQERSNESESESAAAVLLSYSLITSTLGPKISFEAALARLGSKESAEMQTVVEEELEKGGVLLDSVKRKRRKKMSKHKLKKRKRALRELNKRAGGK